MIPVLAGVGALLLAAPAADPSPSPGADATPSASAPASSPAATQTPAPARSGNGSVRMFGGPFTLQAGQVTDSVQVTGGSVRIDGTVTGDVTVFGGSVTIDGSVGHDVRVTGGSLRLGPNASVGHDVSVFGGSIHRAPGAQVGHDVIVNSGGGMHGGSWSQWPFRFQSPLDVLPFNFVPGLGLAVAIVVIGVLLLTVFPRQLASTTAAVVDRPVASLGVGCLTAIAGVLVAVLLAITVVLIPGTVAVVLAMIGAFLFGWTAIVLAVGQQIMDRLDWHGGPIWALVVGGVLAALVLNVPFIGGLVVLLGGACALGAVVLTRFGTQPIAPWLPPKRPPPPAQ